MVPARADKVLPCLICVQFLAMGSVEDEGRFGELGADREHMKAQVISNGNIRGKRMEETPTSSVRECILLSMIAFDSIGSTRNSTILRPTSSTRRYRSAPPAHTKAPACA
jgi:hypothetical protein